MCCRTTLLTQHMGIVISIKRSKNYWNYLKSVARTYLSLDHFCGKYEVKEAMFKIDQRKKFLMSCSPRKTTCDFIQYSKQLDLKAPENNISFFAWNKIYIVLWQTPLQMVMYSSNFLRNYTMYYVTNTYYAIFMILSCTCCGRLQRNFSIQKVLFLWVIILIMLCLEVPLSSCTLRNWSHFALCYFRFSLKFIGVAKSNGKERMTFPLCSSLWPSCQAANHWIYSLS